MTNTFSDLLSRMSPKSRAHAEAKASALLDQIRFEVDADKFKQFTDMLDGPSKPNPGLERLMGIHAPWDKPSGDEH
ncbi:DUF1778 domain-containing protein [Thiomonas sp.]|jgi:uncharacterized protein (DUF1778 family)|uniref:type II toxin-antitoxin system TacA family antitoxin n=1 Tax=Thiomonas sp. TaxID=2047785 RepID=UPI002590B6E3|nr:DUF1778 domain-containing protein [Thiomonas sp.]